MKAKKVISRSKKMTITAPVSSEYEKDFYKWSSDQAKLLKKKAFDKVDLENIIEEIESLGRSDKRALRSHLRVLLMHMLKMEYQPHGGMGNSLSWKKSISNARHEIKMLTDDSPSLKKMVTAFTAEAYEFAKDDAYSETGIPIEVFPKECPWKISEILK